MPATTRSKKPRPLTPAARRDRDHAAYVAAKLARIAHVSAADAAAHARLAARRQERFAFWHARVETVAHLVGEAGDRLFGDLRPLVEVLLTLLDAAEAETGAIDRDLDALADSLGVDRFDLDWLRQRPE